VLPLVVVVSPYIWKRWPFVLHYEPLLLDLEMAEVFVGVGDSVNVEKERC
jgi:hypothetical protein